MANKMTDYFTFQGKRYAKGTIVKFKDEFISKRNISEGYELGYFNGHLAFLEYNAEKKRTHHTIAFACDSEKIIESIVHEEVYEGPIYVKVLKDTQSDDMLYAWIAYIVFMLFSLCCTGTIYGWIAASLWFWPYRHNKLYKLKGHIK